MTHTHHKKGFTLIELAVVLIIVALLVGGILAGKSLLHNAELKESYAEAISYTTAIVQFQDKYQALPGDMFNATSIWGANDAGGGNGDGLGADCIDLLSTNKATCNGNGDGQIGGSAATGYEIFRGWQHLINAELINLSLTGKSDSANADDPFHSNPLTNIPRSAFDGGYNMRYETSDDLYAENVPNHFLIWGNVNGDDYNNNPVLTNPDAFSLDSKMDDGRPGTGNLITFDNWTQEWCATTDSAATAEYTLSDENAVECTMNFLIPLN